MTGLLFIAKCAWSLHQWALTSARYRSSLREVRKDINTKLVVDVVLFGFLCYTIMWGLRSIIWHFYTTYLIYASQLACETQQALMQLCGVVVVCYFKSAWTLSN